MAREAFEFVLSATDKATPTIKRVNGELMSLGRGGARGMGMAGGGGGSLGALGIGGAGAGFLGLGIKLAVLVKSIEAGIAVANAGVAAYDGLGAAMKNDLKGSVEARQAFSDAIGKIPLAGRALSSMFDLVTLKIGGMQRAAEELAYAVEQTRNVGDVRDRIRAELEQFGPAMSREDRARAEFNARQREINLNLGANPEAIGTTRSESMQLLKRQLEEARKLDEADRVADVRKKNLLVDELEIIKLESAGLDKEADILRIRSETAERAERAFREGRLSDIPLIEQIGQARVDRINAARRELPPLIETAQDMPRGPQFAPQVIDRFLTGIREQFQEGGKVKNPQIEAIEESTDVQREMSASLSEIVRLLLGRGMPLPANIV